MWQGAQCRWTVLAILLEALQHQAMEERLLSSSTHSLCPRFLQIEYSISSLTQDIFFFCLDSEWMTICTFCVAQGNNCALISSKGLHSFIRFSAHDSPWATVRRLLSLTPEYHREFFRPPDSLLICYSLLTGSRWLSASRSHHLSVLWTLCFLMDLPPTILSWCLRCCSFLNSLLYWSLREKSVSLFPLQTGSFWSQYL